VEREIFSLLQNAVPVSILKCQKGNLWFSHGAPWTVGTVPEKALAHKNIIFQYEYTARRTRDSPVENYIGDIEWHEVV
jgi:hypothetical protein